MQKRQIIFFKIGGFSQINFIVARELAARFPEYDFRIVDVEKEIIGRRAFLYLHAFIEAVARYGWSIVSQRIHPRNFFCRIPCVLTAIRKWVARNVQPEKTAFTFQTQSLFDARRAGIPHFVYTDHTYLANRRYEGEPTPLLPVAKSWQRMEKELYQKADINFTFSQFAADSITNDYGVPATRVQCVYSGANAGFPFHINTSLRTGLRILFVGVDWERKGGPELVEAFSLVRREISDVELIVVGSDPEIFAPGMTALGRIPGDEVKAYYESSDVFCLPSRRDPAANVLTEAAAYALPVVATPVGGNKERVVDGETGYLVPLGDIELMAKRLCCLLRDEKLRIVMGLKGRERVAEMFHWSGVMDRMSSAIGQRILLH
jgi:glycosyltransferase involved in cell wall biosynthesis